MTMTDTQSPLAAYDRAMHRLSLAFGREAAAREALEAAEDDVRALLREALASGATWSEIEEISGKSEATIQRRFQQGVPPEVVAFDTFGLR